MSTEQILGLITGLAFGFLLQRGRVLRYDKQVGAMLFKDMAIFKFMLSAIVVGMFGILALNDLEIIKLSHKAMNVGAILVGGTLFGIGLLRLSDQRELHRREILRENCDCRNLHSNPARPTTTNLLFSISISGTYARTDGTNTSRPS